MGNHKSTPAPLIMNDIPRPTNEPTICIPVGQYRSLLEGRITNRSSKGGLTKTRGRSNRPIINNLKNRVENYRIIKKIPNDLMLKQTGQPITSEQTKSFDMAREIRSPYDKYWLNIYNNHAKNEDYSL